MRGVTGLPSRDGSLEDVRSEQTSIRWPDADSITQQLYFLLEAFQGVGVELAEVERLVDDIEFLPNLGHRKAIELAKGTNKEADSRERALYRLMLLGVVDDYLVESTFVVNLANISSTGIADALLEFAKRTDPGSQRPSLNEFAARASNLELREAVSERRKGVDSLHLRRHCRVETPLPARDVRRGSRCLTGRRWA